MFEHVGLKRLGEYFTKVADLLREGGRFVNHAISRIATNQPARIPPSGFIARFVFPDGELHEVGTVISALQDHGLEVRHVENLRDHYALTLRRWVANLEANWDAAVGQAGQARAKIWRLYMAASAIAFEDNHLHVDQILATKTPHSGVTGIQLRPTWR